MADLQTSALCDERQYDRLDGDALAKLYDDTTVSYTHLTLPTIYSV